MEDLLRFKKINELKRILREKTPKERKESVAEHSWSSLLLADFFLPKIKQNLNMILLAKAITTTTA